MLKQYNEFLIQEWCSVHEACKGNREQWPLRAKAVLDRTRLVLADKAEHYHKLLQPSAEYLGSLLGVEQWAVCQSHVVICIPRCKSM